MKRSPNIPYQIFMLLLCVFVVMLLAADTCIATGAETKQILMWVDTVLCVIFLGDFCYRLFIEENKIRYLLTWGWIDLISSIPALSAARWGRIARILRIVWLIRGLKSMKVLFSILSKNREQSAMLTAAFVAIITVTFGALAVLQCEEGVQGGNIQTVGDAVWWTIVTMSTVGYGDLIPITAEGRLVAVVLMVVGIGLFGTFTGLFAAWLVDGNKRDNELLERVQRLEQTIEKNPPSP